VVPPEYAGFADPCGLLCNVPPRASQSLRVFGQPINGSQMDAVRVGAQHAVESLWKDRYHAATVDEKPCQYGMILTLFNSGTVGRPVTALRFPSTRSSRRP